MWGQQLLGSCSGQQVLILVSRAAGSMCALLHCVLYCLLLICNKILRKRCCKDHSPEPQLIKSTHNSKETVIFVKSKDIPSSRFRSGVGRWNRQRVWACTMDQTASVDASLLNTVSAGEVGFRRKSNPQVMQMNRIESESSTHKTTRASKMNF